MAPCEPVYHFSEVRWLTAHFLTLPVLAKGSVKYVLSAFGFAKAHSQLMARLF